MTLLEIRSPLGTTTSAPSTVRIVLERMPMRRTSPTSEPTSTTSPTWIGRSKSKISPETKLDTRFCSPKPSPTPSAPASSVTRERPMPAALKASTTPPSRRA